MNRYSDAYLDLLTAGPFPGLIDPWAEARRYFLQIHTGIIDHTIGQIQRALLEMGYLTNRVMSTQVMDIALPEGDEDSLVEPAGPGEEAQVYVPAHQQTREIEINIPVLQAIHITDIASGDLITALEVISPRTKSYRHTIAEYRQRRRHLLDRGVNVVEIDPTRSIKRVLEEQYGATYNYNISVHSPRQPVRVIGCGFGQPMPRYILPLRREIYRVDPQAAYTHAYRMSSIAAHIRADARYQESELPFLRMMTTNQRRESMQRVESWAQALKSAKVELE